MRVAILGRTQMLYDAITYLENEGHKVVLIGTCKAAPEYTVDENDFKKKADELQIPFFNNSSINSRPIIDLLKSVNADIAVSVNWITLISQKVLDMFPYGILNAHFGDLPQYRGNACPNWAIIKGEKQFAISIHFMEQKLDAGDIIVKECYPIDSKTTITDVYEILDRFTPQLFCKAINRIQDGYMGIPQSKNSKDALRCYPRMPQDSIIDWKQTCEEILRVIRASCAPFEGAYTFYGDLKLHIMEGKKKEYEEPCYVYEGQVVRVDRQSGCVEIAAGDGVIVIDSVYIEGEKITASKILRSTRIRLNYCLQEEIYGLRNQILALKQEFLRIGNCLDNRAKAKHISKEEI